MLPWLDDNPDLWVNLETFSRLFNYSYKGEFVNKYCKDGTLADFGFKTCCIIIPGKSNSPQERRWYIKLRD